MFSKQNADELQSRVIAFLRFPLIVGVVFIHNYRPSIIVGNEVMGSETHMPTYSFIGQLFSQYIGWISVPLFFFFSGFLFFYKADYSLQTYIYKIKRRISTLLIPYLFWNASFLICFFAVSHLPLIYKRNFVNIVRIYGYYPYIFYLLMVAVHYAFMVQGHDVQWLFKLIKIAGILSTLNLSAAIVAKHNFRSTTFLASASFFVFAIHDPWLLSNIRKLLYVTLHPASDFAMVVVYFFNILLTVTIALALYYCLKKISPKFTAIITGGR